MFSSLCSPSPLYLLRYPVGHQYFVILRLSSFQNGILWFQVFHVLAHPTLACFPAVASAWRWLPSHDAAGLQLCLACRNMQRAQAARSSLLAAHPMAQVALLQMDASSISSVIAAAQEVKLRWQLLGNCWNTAGLF